MWLAKVAATFAHRTSAHRISSPASFYSKYKSRGFLVSILFLVFWSFDMRVWMAYFFASFKEQWEKRKMYYWSRKVKQMLCEESYHICSFNRYSSGISLCQLSVSSFLEKIEWSNFVFCNLWAVISWVCNVETWRFLIPFWFWNLLLLTTACFKVLLFLWYFFFNSTNAKKRSKNNSWRPKIFPTAVGFGILSTLVFSQIILNELIQSLA